MTQARIVATGNPQATQSIHTTEFLDVSRLSCCIAIGSGLYALKEFLQYILATLGYLYFLGRKLASDLSL